MSWIYDSETGEINPKYASILKALQAADEEQWDAAEAILTQTCGKCWACTLMEDGRHECGDPDSNRTYIKPDDKPCVLFEERTEGSE